MIRAWSRSQQADPPRIGLHAMAVGLSQAALLTALLALAGPAPEAHAGGILVDAADLVPDAGDCGGKTNPCNTIQAGIDAAAAGGKVKIKKGLYNETVVVGTAGLSIRGSGKDAVIIDSELGTALSTCDGDPSRTVYAGGDEVVDGPCGQFDGTDEPTCEAAWARDSNGTPTACYWDGSGCNECVPDEGANGVCVNTCLTCADASRTVRLGQGSSPCRSLDGTDQATCEQAWAINRNGDPVTCTWDSGGSTCEGCGPGNEGNGECTNTCVGIDATVTISAPGVRLRRVFVRNGDTGVIVTDTGAGAVLEGISVRGADDDCVLVQGDETSIVKSNLAGCGGAAVRGYFEDAPGGPSVLHDVTVSRNVIGQCHASCIDIEGDNSTVIGNTVGITANGDCIDLVGDDAVVTGNTAGPCDGYALDVDGDRFTVSDNEGFATDSDAYDLTCDACAGSFIIANLARDVPNDDGGFRIQGETAGLVVQDNEAVRVSDEGFEFYGTGVTIRNNRVSDTGGDNYEPCFDIRGDDHVIEGNSAVGCTDDGYDIGGSGHTMTGNEAIDNREDGFDVSSSATEIVLDGNLATGNNGMGFEVSGGASLIVLQNNVASGNGVDLCDEGTGTTLAGNTVGTTSAYCMVGD